MTDQELYDLQERGQIAGDILSFESNTDYWFKETFKAGLLFSSSAAMELSAELEDKVQKYAKKQLSEMKRKLKAKL